MQYAPTRVRAKFGGFHISAHGCAENASDFIHPNRDTPKTRPILDPNLRRGVFRGVCFYAPTRVHEKFGGFHISAYEYAKNVSDFTFSNKDAPKTHPVLYPNRRRRTFRGVCFCALHGCVKNPSSFTIPHPNTSKTHPILPSPIRIRPKPAQFYTQTVGEGHFGAYAFAPYTGT